MRKKSTGKLSTTKVESIQAKRGEGLLQSDLQNDQVYVNAEMIPLQTLTQLPSDSRFNQAIVSEGKIVNVVSNNYGFLPNDKFFYEFESKLIEADINYVTRSINRDNTHFAVDYILNDDRYHIDVKGSQDVLYPMIRAVNSYGGSPTGGSMGFFRKVCDNGLHTAQTKVGFAIRHKSKIGEIVLPHIGDIVTKFMDNEFFQLKRKFEVLAETPIRDLNDFVKMVADEMDLFKFEKSEKNPEPSKTAQELIDMVNIEANKVSASEINLWLGYNAFNHYIHNKKVATFPEQKRLDQRLFHLVSNMNN